MKIVTLMKTTALLQFLLPQSAVCCVLALAAILPLSCIKMAEADFSDGIPASTTGGTLVEVTVQSLEAPGTKSAWTGQPGRVESFALLAYRDGCLDASVRSEDGADVRIRLFKGKVYQIYALANLSGFVPPRREVDLAALSLPAGDIRLAGGLPMACRTPDFVPSADCQRLVLTFRRLYARLVVRIDKGDLGLLQVGSVRLRQAACCVHPFGDTDAQFCAVPSAGADATALFADGDYATPEDLSRLNAGDSLVLYVPENRQGTLLPGNEDPSLRTPDALGDKAGYCTYLELSASGGDSPLLTGDALCRIYLGCNAADNFDVPGNTHLALTLFLTGRLLEPGWGWRIDSRLSWASASVTGWIADAIHPSDDLYVGEGFHYVVRPSEDFLRGVGGDFSRCSLRFSPGAGMSPVAASPSDADAAAPDTSLLFSAWEPSGDGIWYTEVRCRRPVPSGQLRFCLDGNELFVLEPRLCVKLPRFVLQAPEEVRINADTLSSCVLDMLDARGRSLRECPFFDSSLFTPVYSLSVSPEVCAPPLDSFFRLTPCPPSGFRACGGCQVGFSHAGRDTTLQRFLTQTLRQDEVFSLRVSDARYPVADDCAFRTDIRPVQLRLCERGGADARWALLVDNPSALPLELGLVLSARTDLSQESVPQAPSPRLLQTYSGMIDYPVLAEREKIRSCAVRDSIPLALSAVFQRSYPDNIHHPFAFFGIEPALSYGEIRDRRLDGKIAAACAFSPQVPLPCCVFASQEAQWQGETQLDEPVWLRYSAYDDVGKLHVTAGFSEPLGVPTVRCVADKGMPELYLAYYGNLYASLYVYPNGRLWGGDYLYQAYRYYVCTPMDAIPTDGQVFPCTSGSFSAALTDLYAAAVQDDYTILGTSHFQHHPHPDRVEYGCSITVEQPERILTATMTGSLDFVFHHQQDNVDLPVSSVFTGFFGGSTLHIYDY